MANNNLFDGLLGGLGGGDNNLLLLILLFFLFTNGNILGDLFGQGPGAGPGHHWG